MTPRRRPSTVQLLRALWRYRGKIERHGSQYQVELATAVRTALDAQVAGRVALGGYRLAMRVLLAGAVALVALGLFVAWILWHFDAAAALGALLFLVPTGFLVWWRKVWGAPLDWLDEYADTGRTVSPTELPGRLRAVAAELRGLADVPASISQELDALAGDIDAERPPAP